MTTILPTAGLGALNRRSALLFHFRAADLSLRALSGQIGTFTRASRGTAFDSNGVLYSAAHSAPRWNMVNGQAGLLLEGARTNLLLYTQDFNNAAWVKTNVTVSVNATTAPDGSLTADKVAATTTASTLLTQTAAVAGTSAAYSVHVKRGSGDTVANRFALRNFTTSTWLAQATLNYATGVLTVATGTGTVEALADGWYRVRLSASAGITSGDSLIGYACFDSLAATAADYAYAWGAQLEVGPFSSSYIVTSAATVTRSADLLQFPFNLAPCPLTVYARLVDAGYALTPNGSAWVIGNLNGSIPMIVEQIGSGFYHDGVGQSASILALANSRGDVLESLLTLNATADVVISRITNGGAPAIGTNGVTATQFLSAFSAPTVTLGGGSSWPNGNVIIQSLKIAAGVRTFAQMQAAY